MEIVAISDTHGQHENLQLPKADLIIHAGDVTGRGTKDEVQAFLDWYADLDYRYKIFIAGNHDWFFEERSEKEVQEIIPRGLIYLNDSGIEIEGVKIWGSPIQPFFFNWAFNRRRGQDIARYWDLIPNDTDIIITHGPVYGILDKTVKGDLTGCQDLLEKIKTINPKVHICGHIHEAYGEAKKDGVFFINASVLNEHYHLKNNPIKFNVNNLR